MVWLGSGTSCSCSKISCISFKRNSALGAGRDCEILNNAAISTTEKSSLFIFVSLLGRTTKLNRQQEPLQHYHLSVSLQLNAHMSAAFMHVLTLANTIYCPPSSGSGGACAEQRRPKAAHAWTGGHWHACYGPLKHRYKLTEQDKSFRLYVQSLLHTKKTCSCKKSTHKIACQNSHLWLAWFWCKTHSQPHVGIQ